MRNTMIRVSKAGIIFFSSLLLLSFAGCSNKIPDAEPVKWHKNSALTINKEFLLTKDFKVPKDPSLKNENWTFQAVAQKQGKYLFKNEDITKIFLVAHNSSEIILVGRSDLVNEYKNYFLENQVTANIKLQEINPITKDFNKVNILFFNGIN